jgi:hypothetical protein
MLERKTGICFGNPPQVVSERIAFSRLRRKVIDEDVILRKNVLLFLFCGGLKPGPINLQFPCSPL